MQTSSTYAIILNPVAGTGKAGKKWVEMEALLQTSGISFEVFRTKMKGHAMELAKEAILSGFRRIIAVGGDGTNNEVVNGIFNQDQVPTTDILYTLIPVGTGNDWVKTHGIPRDFKKWIPLIAKEKIVQQDVGLVKYHWEGKQHERHFVNVAGMAYDGYVGKKVDDLGKVSGKLVYLYYLLSELFSYRNKKAAVIYNDKVFEGAFYSINLGVCKYSGGGMQLVPHAIPNDGLLALTYDTGLSKLNVVTMTPRLFMGNIHKHKKVVTKQVKMCRVEAREDEPTFLEVDGEFLGTTPCEFYVKTRVLNVIVP